MRGVTGANWFRGLAGPGLGVLLACTPAWGGLCLGPEGSVPADGQNIFVPGYSVPALVCWDGDALPDLLVGEGGNGWPGKVRLYLNQGTAGSPQFGGWSYLQAAGADISETAGYCLGAFPRAVDWNGDARPDLLVGLADGTVKLYLNISTNGIPELEAGTYVSYGPPGGKVLIDVDKRATPTAADWNGDGLFDLVVGSYDGRIHLFINSGTNAAPDFAAETFAQGSGGDLLVDSARSSPHLVDINHDDRPDLLSGNTDGMLLLFRNVGSVAAPDFTSGELVAANGVPIDLPGAPRSRPFACDWNTDGRLDVLMGTGDGLVLLYLGQSPPGDLDSDSDVDLLDAAAFANCLSGPGVSGCPFPCSPQQFTPADLDADGDVDLRDFAVFQGLIEG